MHVLLTKWNHDHRPVGQSRTRSQLARDPQRTSHVWVVQTNRLYLPHLARVDEELTSRNGFGLWTEIQGLGRLGYVIRVVRIGGSFFANCSGSMARSEVCHCNESEK